MIAKVESMTRRLITIARLIALLRYRARARRANQLLQLIAEFVAPRQADSQCVYSACNMLTNVPFIPCHFT